MQHSWKNYFPKFGWDCTFHFIWSLKNIHLGEIVPFMYLNHIQTKDKTLRCSFIRQPPILVPPNQKILIEKEMTTLSDLQPGVPAAFGLRAFCVQKIVGMKIWTIKSQVSPYELNPDSEMLPVTRIPRQREKHHEARLSAFLFNHVQRAWFYPSGINTHCWTGTYLHLPVVLFALWEVWHWEHASS